MISAVGCLLYETQLDHLIHAIKLQEAMLGSLLHSQSTLPLAPGNDHDTH